MKTIYSIQYLLILSAISQKNKSKYDRIYLHLSVVTGETEIISKKILQDILLIYLIFFNANIQFIIYYLHKDQTCF